MLIPGFDFPAQLPPGALIGEPKRRRFSDVTEEKRAAASEALAHVARYDPWQTERLLTAAQQQRDTALSGTYRPFHNRRILVTTASGCRYLVSWAWVVERRCAWYMRTESEFQGVYGEALEAAGDYAWEVVANDADGYLTALIETDWETVAPYAVQVSGPVPADRAADWLSDGIDAEDL